MPFGFCHLSPTFLPTTLSLNNFVYFIIADICKPCQIARPFSTKQNVQFLKGHALENFNSYNI